MCTRSTNLSKWNRRQGNVSKNFSQWRGCKQRRASWPTSSLGTASSLAFTTTTFEGELTVDLQTSAGWVGKHHSTSKTSLSVRPGVWMHSQRKSHHHRKIRWPRKACSFCRILHKPRERPAYERQSNRCKKIEPFTNMCHSSSQMKWTPLKTNRKQNV